LGVDAVLFRSLTNKQVKKDLFSEDFGLQIGFRKKIIDYNFLSIIMGGTNSNRNLYNFQFIRTGYESGNVFGVKNLFVIPEIVVKRYSSKDISKDLFAVAPSIGVGYNLKINKNLLIRSYHNFEYNIPNEIGTVFSNLTFGVHYLFD